MSTPVQSRPRPPVSGERRYGHYFVATYPPFSCWSAGELPHLEAALERRVAKDEGGFGLYVHLPFCEERCDYCHYLSSAHRSANEIDRYLQALVEELRLYRRMPALGERPLDYVYFGGGTPSLLSRARVERLITGFRELFCWRHAREVTFECAPRSVTAAKLELLKELGVTRISLGVQHFDDEVLRRNGRVHTVADVERAYAAIGELGFPVVNLDLIVGLPGESEDTHRNSIDRLLALAPSSATLYQLEIPFNTPLYTQLSDGRGTDAPISWETKRRRLGGAFRRLEEAGYTVRSAYAAVRDPHRHRFVYQEDQYRGGDLLGIGASSFSYLMGVHQQNVTSLRAYCQSLSEPRLPWGRAHRLSEEERLVRELILQLKLGGCAAAHFERRFGIDVAQRFHPELAAAAARSWLEVDADGVRLTRQGLLRADHLIRDFYLPQHRDMRYS